MPEVAMDIRVNIIVVVIFIFVAIVVDIRLTSFITRQKIWSLWTPEDESFSADFVFSWEEIFGLLFEADNHVTYLVGILCQINTYLRL